MNKSIIILTLIFALITGVLLGSVFNLNGGAFAGFSDLSESINKFQMNNLLTESSKSVANPTSQILDYKPVEDYEARIVSAVESASQAVVSIVISKDVAIIENCPYDPFSNLPPEFKDFFGGNFNFSQPCEKGTERREVGGGSGFLISKEGMLVTNKHVVTDAKASYTVFTSNGKKYEAKILARDPLLDFAVLKIEGNDFPVLTIGNSDGIKLGQTVIAIGNALAEFRNTVSTGVISGLQRNVTASGGGTSEIIEGVIQTDAAINPGNSGGPLLNLKGEVIAINTAVASGAENIGFAIPINQVKRAIRSIQTTGKIVIPYLGVRYVPVTAAIIEKEKLDLDYGAIIRGSSDGPAIMKDSPAEKAGVLAEDIILEINGKKINENNSLSYLIQEYSVGEIIKLKVYRNKNYIDLNLKLEERKF